MAGEALFGAGITSGRSHKIARRLSAPRMCCHGCADAVLIYQQLVQTETVFVCSHGSEIRVH